MNNVYIEETKYTPEIDLNYEKGTITIKGKSYPENTFEFYESTVKWLEEYFDGKAKETTTVNFEIIYFNSSSSKLFFDIFDIFEENFSENTIIINWIYDEENESALEAGEDFQEDFEELTINLVSK